MDILELVQEGKIKRYFRSRKKLSAPGLICHITQRAAGKEPLFVEDGDYLGMIWLIKEASRKHSFKVYAFCLMPNHLHLLLEIGSESVFKIMQTLFSSYARKFNKKYERKGHLFAGPYRQSVCTDPSYLLAASLYIHLNPVRAGLSEDPYNYRWSSCRLYGRKARREAFVDPKLVLSVLSPDMAEAHDRYRILLQSGAQAELKPAGEEPKAVELLLAFLGKKVPLLWSWLRPVQREGVAHSNFQEKGQDWEACLEQWKARGLTKRVGKEALMHAVEQLLARGYRRSEIAGMLGVSRKTLYNRLR